MRAIDLETRVLAAVDQIRRGQQVETDFIECKREWPEDKKARQLAGSLNRAAGDPVIYIVGIDEKTGLVTDVSGTDVLNWWNQIIPKFDQTPPEITRHMDVVVDSNGEKIVALVFASDRAPYVIKTGLGNPSLEIPIREGSGTRSARRDEVLRMLMPTVKVPTAVALDGNFYSEYYPAVNQDHYEDGRYSQEEGMRCNGQLRLYFEHSGRETITLPGHGMRGTLKVGGETFEASVAPYFSSTSTEPQHPYGALAKRDGIVLTSPGSALVTIKLKTVTPESRELFRQASTIEIDLELEVMSAVRPLRVSVIMTRTSEGGMESDYQDFLGSWHYSHSSL